MFSNLYLGKYCVVERSTGVVIPLRDGALAVSGTYPTVDSRTKAKYRADRRACQERQRAVHGLGVQEPVFYSLKGKALDGSWTYDAYYLSFVMATSAMSIITTSRLPILMRVEV